MITYTHIYANDQLYQTVTSRDTLAQIIAALRANTGTWITIVETYHSDIQTTVAMPLPTPTIDELEVSAEHKQILLDIVALGPDAVCPPLNLNQ